MKYFDVDYINPSGYLGKHYAVLAKDHNDAAKESAVLLCSGTIYTPDQFQIIRVDFSQHTPKNTQITFAKKIERYFDSVKYKVGLIKRYPFWQNSSSEEEQKRKEICSGCNRLSSVKFCKECGCYMPIKIKIASAKCPVDKW